MACFLAGTDTLAKANPVGSSSRAQNPDGTRTGHSQAT